MISSLTFEKIKRSHSPGQRAEIVIMYLSQNKNLLKVKEGRNLLRKCKDIKSKWDEYEKLKYEYLLINKNLNHDEYEKFCLNICELLGI